MSFINEIFTLDEIFSLEQRASKKYGIQIPNVSYWDSSETFQKHMKQVLVLPPASLPWNYYYTYSISLEDRQQVLKNLGVQVQDSQSIMGLLLQSSTIAIVNMINLLVNYNYKKICIIQPAYFSVASCCSMLSLEYGMEQISFTDGHPQLPVKAIISGGYDCIWFTSPIFCTGYYPDSNCINDLKQLKSMGLTLIFDESLALPGTELVRHFPINKKIFAIYSPHKAISMNGLKFSVLVCDKNYEDFLEQWVDVFSGALSGSNRDAVFHYISDNYFDACYPAYKEYICKAKQAIDKIIERFPFAFMLPNTDGHYISVFMDLKTNIIKDGSHLLEDVINTSMASFIPSTLNGFDTSQGFGFRINLTMDFEELKGALTRIMQYFSAYA